ncbi:MAG: RICIN domain-containing protein [Paraprevotella sp.]|nr:RICIN domain-containing protein [Paraprevotella sp.]
MKINRSYLISFLFAGGLTYPTFAQTYSSSSNLTAQPAADHIVPFKLSEQGVTRQVEWGADEAWISEQNLRRCVAFMGKDNVSVVRVSFQPTHALVDGDLQQEQKDTINERIRLLGFCSPDVKLELNCDHPSVDAWYKGNAERWAQLMDVTARYFQEAGYQIASIAPFNEPDYTQTGQGTLNDFYNIAGELRKNTRFDNVRICGGNTLNCDQALPWYNSLKDRLDEGNTHQLAGSFDNFAKFYTTVRNEGKHATADEMHNVMEAMVGMEYGLQTGIWWGPAEYARGEFCKASHGERLAYAEDRPNWTAASVYRAPDGKIQAFGGTSERQAVTTSYRFLSKERDVFFNGYGPQREFVMELPGGTGYQTGQTNAEQVVNITWGDDVQPVVDGTYLLINKYNKKLLDVSNNNPTTTTYTANKKTQQWQVNPVDSRIGGDFSYFQILSANNAQTLDVLNWSLEDKAEVILYQNDKSANQQWYLEYAGDGWFRIRHRNSSLCLSTQGESVVQSELDSTDDTELWRFVPTNVRPRVRNIDAPTGVQISPRASSILLTWNPTSATEPTYTILRSESADGEYDIIARNVADTAFVDNKVQAGQTYYYTVKTVDASVNTSPASTVVSSAATGEDDLIASYEFEENVRDTTLNLNHGATATNLSYTEGKSGAHALELNGSTDYVQLPTQVADQTSMTIAAWIYWKGGDSWQRIFDFGNGEDEYMFLTPRSDASKVRFAIKSNGTEEQLDGESLTTQRNKWIHLAITLDENGITLYQNGEAVASSTSITTRPSDFHPVLNYIGRSQFTDDPLFNGYIDDFRIYNYALSPDEIKAMADQTDGVGSTAIDAHLTFDVAPLPADFTLEAHYSYPQGPEKVEFRLYDLQGNLLSASTGTNGATTSIRVAGLANGLYILKAQCGSHSESKKITVRHE